MTLSEGRPVREVVRRNQRRQITISGDVAGRKLSKLWDDVNHVLDDMQTPSGTGFVAGGEQEEINNSFADKLV